MLSYKHARKSQAQQKHRGQPAERGIKMNKIVLEGKDGNGCLLTKEGYLEKIAVMCETLDEDQYIIAKNFGEDRSLVLDITMDGECETVDIVTMKDCEDGEVVDDAMGICPFDVDLDIELQRIWEGKDFSTL